MDSRLIFLYQSSKVITYGVTLRKLFKLTIRSCECKRVGVYLGKSAML